MSNVLEDLKTLAELKANGVIDDREFAVLKTNIMKSLDATKHSVSFSEFNSSAKLSSLSMPSTMVSQPTTSTLISGNLKPKAATQATLHNFFGPSFKRSKTGVLFVSTQMPLTVRDALQCNKCEKRCSTNQALIAHQKTHSENHSVDFKTQNRDTSSNKGAVKRFRYSFSEKVRQLKQPSYVPKMA